MKITVEDLFDLVVDLTGRTYGSDGGVVDHAFESTGEWATEVLEALGVIVAIDGSRCRFRVLPRAEWPALQVEVQVHFHGTHPDGTDGAAGPITTAEIQRVET